MRSIESYNNAFGEGAYDRIIDRMSLADVMDALSHDERQVIKLRYFKNLTQSKIAGMLGISQVQVSRIEKRVLLKMREMLG
jgi:RNA polymerase sporulation-specific sigma factor